MSHFIQKLNNEILLGMSAYLVLENERIFKGVLFGYQGNDCVSGEIVFQTGMVGYPESMTDPSYKNQILLFTYPLIGNYGIGDNSRDKYGFCKNFESEEIQVSAIVVSEYESNPSHWNSTKSIDNWLKEHKVIGISGIDTRELTKIIRDYGTMKAKIVHRMPKISKKIEIDMTNLVSKVSRKNCKVYNESNRLKVLVIDCGIKYNQLRMLLKYDVELKVVPWDYDFMNDRFDRIFISNGPGDPSDCQLLIERLKEYMLLNENIPIFGICLGHQLLSIAAGCQTYKMKYGNRGHNIPCQLVGSNKCFITSQNHGYAVKSETIPDDWNELFVNLNDNSNEGIIHKCKPYYSVQFHPEGMAGPMDSEFLFDIFISGNIEKLRDMQKDLGSNNYKKIYKKVLILGSGGLSIGQSGEFDYSGSQAIKALNEEGLTTILINPNIATVQTSPGFADKVYFLPITADFVVQVIEQERPDCIALSFGGQTGLNCGIELYQRNVFEDYGITVLGTQIVSIIKTEDREQFKNVLLEVGENVLEGVTANNYDEAYNSATKIGFPVLVRSAYALGGLGSGFANNEEELSKLLKLSFSNSSQVIVDKSLKGWKEVEYEIVRDAYDNCIAVCNMENIDPLGIHTGESIVVAPSQTLTNYEYNMLRSVSIKIIKYLGIVGECNIQYALDPKSEKYYIIEVNARLSRSSALASKATGYPLAYIAAKLGLGYSLADIKNSITKNTTSCFEPSLDYCVVKIPRWDLDKFPLVNRELDSSMKSIGEAMAISRNFEESFQKALRMSNESLNGFDPESVYCIDEELTKPTFNRMLAIANGLYGENYNIDTIHDKTKIDKWFLNKFKNIIDIYKQLEISKIDRKILRRAKQLGFSDRQIATCIKSTEIAVRNIRGKYNIYPVVKQIDTVAGEFPCSTNYLYTTYSAKVNDVEFNVNPIIVLGSGVYKIGSSVEFDWCTVNCIRELRKLGEHPIIINCNPETVSTDYDEADRLYFDELSFETVMDIYHLENSKGIILAMGGQIPNNIAMSLYRQNVKIFGTSPEMIDRAENRYKFSRTLDTIGVDQPEWKELTSIQEAINFCNKVKYPCLVRPSYVLSGAAMNVAYLDKDLEEYLNNAVKVSKDYPIVITKFITDAKEIEVDAVASNGKVILWAMSEHVENAGVHSGDATLILPPQDLTNDTILKIKKSVNEIAKSLFINGPFNIQFIAKDDEVKVIECNLRVSRTFPFVSKTLDVNFIEIATKTMMGLKTDNITPTSNIVGVKVPQFSFQRLKGADVSLGVEMVSTGEVACFGLTHHEAFLKAMLASGFKIPRKNILISIGSYKFKNEFLESVYILEKIGYNLIGTAGTVDFYSEHNIKIKELPLYSPNNQNCETIFEYINHQKIDLVINISQKNKVRCIDNAFTDGYNIRRNAVENSVSIITDIKKAKLFVESIEKYHINNGILNVNGYIDCLTSYKVVKLPGLIDVHVHIREPGKSYKGDWESETKAALAGGITAICVMPNTDPPVVDLESFETISNIANDKAFCDYAIFVGANSHNASNIHKLSEKAAALKMYLNNTYGPLLLDKISDWSDHVKNWPDNRPLCVHAESKTLPAILHIATLYQKKIHVCHVSSKDEIEVIRKSKEMGRLINPDCSAVLGMNITCEVSPHHLFMDNHDKQKLDYYAEVKPPLMESEDVKALWQNLDIIDCFATDHAPHTKEDKEKHKCPGFPGLETALPLLLTAVKNGYLTLDDIILRYHTNPKKIFGLPTQENTYIEVDLDKEWIIPDKMKYSKCGWTPFAGKKVTGLVRRVVIRDKVVFVDGEVLSQKGSGINMRQFDSTNNNNVNTLFPDGKLTLPSIKTFKAETNLNIKSIISVEQFTRDMLRFLFNKADDMRILVKNKGTDNLLKDKVMALAFYEPSTRTRCSFVAAMKRLGGSVVETNINESSIKKGESLEDSIKCLECYTDITILRTSKSNNLKNIMNIISNPIINAGDGVGEHPTQALLDVYTIREERGTVNGLTITIVGDLKNGRTVHSLAKLLCLYDIRLRYVSSPSLKMPQEIKDYVNDRGIEQSEHQSLTEVLHTTDILYVTRIQRERFESEAHYQKVRDAYIITPQILTDAKPNLVVMHPLPRVKEISSEIDRDPRAAYFRQMENGLYLRMALLASMFGR